MNKTRVLTLSYIIEDGMFEVLDQDAGEFKWWTHVTNTDMASSVQVEEDYDETDGLPSLCSEINWQKTVDKIVETWDCDDGDEEFGLSRYVNEFIELLNKYTEKCVYNGFSLVNWSVEYDVNVSVIVNMQ